MQRKLLVHATSGYKYKRTPTLQLKGNYLKKFGFDIGMDVIVELGEGQITITKAPVSDNA